MSVFIGSVHIARDLLCQKKDEPRKHLFSRLIELGLSSITSMYKSVICEDI